MKQLVVLSQKAFLSDDLMLKLIKNQAHTQSILLETTKVTYIPSSRSGTSYTGRLERVNALRNNSRKIFIQ